MKTLAVSAGLLFVALGWLLALWARHRSTPRPRAAELLQEPSAWVASLHPATELAGFKLTEFDELPLEVEPVTAAPAPDPEPSTALTATPNKTRRLQKIPRKRERAPNGPSLRHRATNGHGMA
jgi:hypothetical protein